MNQTLPLNIMMISTQKAQRAVGKWTFFVFTADKATWLTAAGVGRVVVSGSCQTFCCYSWIFVGSYKSIPWPCCK